MMFERLTVFARGAEPLAGKREQLPANGSAPRANALTAPHHLADGTGPDSVCAVMYLGQLRTVRGDKEWDAN